MNKFLYIFTVFIRAELSEVGGILPMGGDCPETFVATSWQRGKGVVR